MEETFTNKVLKYAASLDGYKAYAVKGHDTFGYVITPSDNVLSVNKGDFGGVRISFDYIPSKEHGSGCSCNDDAIYEVDSVSLKILEESGLRFAEKIGANRYASSEQWLNKCYWRKDLIRL